MRTKYFLGDPVKKLPRPLEETRRKKKMRPTKAETAPGGQNKNRTNKQTETTPKKPMDVRLGRKDSLEGQRAAPRSCVKIHPRSRKRRRAKVIKQSEDRREREKKASGLGSPPLQHRFQKCNVSSVCVGNVAVRPPPPPPPAPSSVIGRKER